MSFLGELIGQVAEANALDRLTEAERREQVRRGVMGLPAPLPLTQQAHEALRASRKDN